MAAAWRLKAQQRIESGMAMAAPAYGALLHRRGEMAQIGGENQPGIMAANSGSASIGVAASKIGEKRRRRRNRKLSKAKENGISEIIRHQAAWRK